MSELVEAIAQVLHAGPPLRLAVLFGSVAEGRAHTGSDVDIAILPRDTDLLLSDELALQDQLARATGRSVDLVRIDRSPAALRWQIASKGQLLVADPIWEWTRFRAQEASSHADISDALERYAHVFLRRVARSRR
jgi:predicted nucleotidyltransferase